MEFIAVYNLNSMPNDAAQHVVPAVGRELMESGDFLFTPLLQGGGSDPMSLLRVMGKNIFYNFSVSERGK